MGAGRLALTHASADGRAQAVFQAIEKPELSPQAVMGMFGSWSPNGPTGGVQTKLSPGPTTSATARRYRMVGAAEINQVLRQARSPQRDDAAEQDIVRADRGDISDLAVEGNRAVGENGCAGCERRPHRRGEPFCDGNLAAE